MPTEPSMLHELGCVCGGMLLGWLLRELVAFWDGGWKG